MRTCSIITLVIVHLTLAVAAVAEVGNASASSDPPAEQTQPRQFTREDLSQLAPDALIHLCLNLQSRIRVLEATSEIDAARKRIAQLEAENQQLRARALTMQAPAPEPTPAPTAPISPAAPAQPPATFNPDGYNYTYNLHFYVPPRLSNRTDGYYEPGPFKGFKHSRNRVRVRLNVVNRTGGKAHMQFTIQVCQKSGLVGLGGSNVEVLGTSRQYEMWLEVGEMEDVEAEIRVKDAGDINFAQLADVQIRQVETIGTPVHVSD